MIKVLVLEDNLKALKAIFEVLEELESKLGKLAVTVFSEAEKAGSFLKNSSEFDLVLLDYYSIDGNFHQAVFNSQILPEKIIAISSLERWNLEAEKKGVARSIQKDFSDLENFRENLREKIKEIIKN